MFFGDQPPLYLLEIAFRCGFIYLYTLLLFRMIGKSDRREMTPIQILIIVALGSAVGDSMFYPEVPLVHAMVVVTSLVFLNNLIERSKLKSPFMYKLLNSTATKVVEKGKLLTENMESEHLPEDELFSLLRMQGIEDLGEVKLAYLELGGDLSVYPYKSKRPKKKSLLP